FVATPAGPRSGDDARRRSAKEVPDDSAARVVEGRDDGGARGPRGDGAGGAGRRPAPGAGHRETPAPGDAGDDPPAASPDGKAGRRKDPGAAEPERERAAGGRGRRGRPAADPAPRGRARLHEHLLRRPRRRRLVDAPRRDAARARRSRPPPARLHPAERGDLPRRRRRPLLQGRRRPRLQARRAQRHDGRARGGLRHDERAALEPPGEGGTVLHRVRAPQHAAPAPVGLRRPAPRDRADVRARGPPQPGRAPLVARADALLLGAVPRRAGQPGHERVQLPERGAALRPAADRARRPRAERPRLRPALGGVVRPDGLADGRRGALGRLRPERLRSLDADRDLRHRPLLEVEAAVAVGRLPVPRLPDRGARAPLRGGRACGHGRAGRGRRPRAPGRDPPRLGALRPNAVGLQAALGRRPPRRLGERGPRRLPARRGPRRPLPALPRPDVLPDRVLEDPPPVRLRPRAAHEGRQLGLAPARVPPRRPRRAQILTGDPMHPLRTLALTCLLAAPALAADALRVVATTADLGAIAAAVGGDAVEVTTLARAAEDPHFVDAKPSFIRTLNRAQVLIEGGAALEAGWLPPLLDGARNTKLAPGAPGRVVASRDVALRDVPSALDRAMGDIHPYGNPHFLLDPANAKTVAAEIAAALCAVDGARCAGYRSGADGFRAAIDAKLPEWQRTLAPARGTKVVTYHKDYDYFAARFGLDVLGNLEPKPGIPPSPTHLAELVPRMVAAKARLVLVEPFRERQTADFVAGKTEAKVVVLPIMPTGSGPDAYVAMIDEDVRRVAEALR